MYEKGAAGDARNKHVRCQRHLDVRWNEQQHKDSEAMSGGAPERATGAGRLVTVFKWEN